MSDHPYQPDVERPYDRAQHTALRQGIEAAGVRDQRVLDAVARTPREWFVPAEHAGTAYVDAPVPIGHGQVTSQPSLIAQMVAAVRPAADEQALEVGTGFGYQTALLARLARHVWSIERDADLSEQARRNLTAADINNVTVVTGDGTRGIADHAPYQAIIVSATGPSVPPPLVEQLAEGGRLAQPITTGMEEHVILFSKRSGRLVEEHPVTPARFVPLVGEHGRAE